MSERPLVETLAEAAAQERWHGRMGRPIERRPVYSTAVLVEELPEGAGEHLDAIRRETADGERPLAT